MEMNENIDKGQSQDHELMDDLFILFFFSVFQLSTGNIISFITEKEGSFTNKFKVSKPQYTP